VIACQRLTNAAPGGQAGTRRSDDLTTAQARALADRMRKLLGYLNRLETRMAEQGFPIDDELYRATVKARDAMHELAVKAHYLGCKGSTGGRR
jgi:hypothetical protein